MKSVDTPMAREHYRFMRISRVALALLMTLPACAFGDIWTPECGTGRAPGVEIVDLIGTYGNRQVGTLRLNADLTFEAKGLRRRDHARDTETIMTGTGTWKLNERGGRTTRSDDYADVPLTFANTGETWFRIDIAASPVGYVSQQVGFDLELYYLLGDLSECQIVTLGRQGPAPRKPSLRRLR